MHQCFMHTRYCHDDIINTQELSTGFGLQPDRVMAKEMTRDRVRTMVRVRPRTVAKVRTRA